MDPIKKALSRINSVPQKTFEVQYIPTYRALVHNHVANDPQHPHHEVQKRRVQQRKKEGLWWSATISSTLSKSKCVRGWAKRRVKTAMIEELRIRGFDETGKLVHAETMQKSFRSADQWRLKIPMDLTGSLRLSIQPAILRAKHTQVREQASKVIDAIMHRESPVR